MHEFDKVELFAYSTAEQAQAVHADMLDRATRLLEALDLEYRVLDLCAGDLGISSARTFDLEVYAPGCDMWLEVSSVSWCSDYQARRANVRYRPVSGGCAGARAHLERLGARLAADLGGSHRVRPDGGRGGGAPGGARAVPRYARSSRPSLPDPSNLNNHRRPRARLSAPEIEF